MPSPVAHVLGGLATGSNAFYERLGITHSRNEHIHMIKGDAFDAFAESGANAS